MEKVLSILEHGGGDSSPVNREKNDHDLLELVPVDSNRRVYEVRVNAFKIDCEIQRPFCPKWFLASRSNSTSWFVLSCKDKTRKMS